MTIDEPGRIKHLLRRAAFGCRPSEWARWSALGSEGTLNALVDYEAIPNTLSTLPVDSLGALVAPQDTDSLKRYWIYRFCETTRPLEEVMTLFWHGHFATSDYKVQNPNTEWRQNMMLRKHAMGNFRDLIGAIAVDPAMLVWLDGNNSKKTAPNENFARELMELFTMGVDGGYTEKDVKAGAKCYTGWSYDDDKSKVNYHPKDHDDTVKLYLGQSGNWDTEQALDIVVRQPSMPKFISRKLFEFFVHDNPPEDEIDRLAARFTETNLSIRELVRAVLTSPQFYSDEAMYSRVKTPVQYAVSIVKTLDIPYRWLNDMQSYTDRMGQKLFDPPNVKGWKMGRNWINTDTMTARLNYATHAVDSLRYRGLMKDHVTAAFNAMGRNADVIFSNAEDAVLAVWEWLLPSVKIPDQTYSALVAYMLAGAPKTPTKNYFWDRSSGLVELVLTCPQFQYA